MAAAAAAEAEAAEAPPSALPRADVPEGASMTPDPEPEPAGAAPSITSPRPPGTRSNLNPTYLRRAAALGLSRRGGEGPDWKETEEAA
jgi:hypothetical protein